MQFVFKMIFYVCCVVASSLLFMDYSADKPTSWEAGGWPLLAMVFFMISDMQQDLIRQYKDIVTRLRETRNVKL